MLFMIQVIRLAFYSSTAHIVSEMEVISNMKSRQEMMKKVPKDLFSVTCIGCGLDLAVQVHILRLLGR